MNVICFGDSNTYGYDPRSYFGGRYPKDSRWVDLLAEKTGWQITNLGANGRCVPAAAAGLPANTDLCIVMLGTNDLLQGSTPEQTSQRMRRFLQGLSVAPQKVLLIAPPPMTPGEWVKGEGLVEASRELAGCYRTLAEELGTRFADAGAWNIPLAYDGAHFTGQGHRTFAEELYKEIAR